jgi:beta-galactosidase
MKNEDLKNDSQTGAGWLRRDALKAAVLLAAPLAGQTRGVASGPPSAVTSCQRNQPFDEGWRFLRADAPGAEAPGFDDAAWRTLDLPHDFSVEDLPSRTGDDNGLGTVWGITSPLPTRVGPFDTELSAGKRDTGWFVGGTGWYRKRFSAAAIPSAGQVEIVFDGVYMNSDVWLNGNLLGNHPYGYTSFAYDLTPHLRRTGENVLAVRVKNEGRNSRWYSGSGIYRHVWLNATGTVRLPLWGVAVTTPDVSREKASVKVTVRVENRGKQVAETIAQIRLLDSTGAVVGSGDIRQTVPADGSTAAEQVIAVANPQLWSPATPRLYLAEVELITGGKPVDKTTASFGIRKLELDMEHGLRINGESVKLRGGCMHHDNGLLGACAFDRAEERRVELMKAHGFNAIRCAHNPPSPSFLDACDRLGVLVIDEAFDQWESQKDDIFQGYHLYFPNWWRKDIDALVLRDQNHPSVILWSIGNEIPECTKPRGVEIQKQLVDYVKSLDPTRPVAAAINGFGGSAKLDPAFQYLDVAGYNYLLSYESDHDHSPKRIICGTESFPMQAYASWAPVEKFPYLIGDFVWTAMDYLGEAAIGNAQLNTPPAGGGRGAAGGSGGSGGSAPMRQPFPWFNSYCGDIDLIGQSKPQWLHRKVIWGLSKLEMAVQRPVPEGRNELVSGWGWSDELCSWTWPGADGKKVKVRVYSTGDSVQLLLNGQDIASKPVSPATQLKAEFEVAYAPGELKAVAFSKGEKIAEAVFKTVGKPAKLRLAADRKSIQRKRTDLSYVTLEVLDQNSQLVPDAVLPVAFSVSGAGELAASGTANPKDVASFRQPRLKTYHGRALAIIRPKGIAGLVTVRVEAGGFAPASAVIQVT